MLAADNIRPAQSRYLIRSSCRPAGEIVRSNDAIMEQPRLAHTDPYGAAWLVVMLPDDWRAAKALLTPGHKVAEPYLELMRLANFAGCGAGC